MTKEFITAVRALSLTALLATALSAHPLILTPNGGEMLIAGKTYVIQWQILIPHSTQGWHLAYSTQGLQGPWLPIATGLPAGNTNAGSIHSYSWTVPMTASSQVRVRVEQDNGRRNYFDWSDQDLTIVVPGDYSAHGVGCSGAHGIPTLSAAGAPPKIGMPFSVTVANLDPQAGRALMMTGVLFSQPIDLTSIGAPTCLAYVDSYVTSTLITQAGSALWTAVIPNLPALIGSSFANQVISLDPKANGLGLVVSAAAVGRIGM